MAAAEKFIVSNALCFIINKYHVLAPKPLKSLLSDFYCYEDIANAKELLLVELDLLKSDKTPKIVRRRRDSAGGKLAVDYNLDDIMAAVAFLDENKLLDKIATFVASSPESMPSSRLVEGDLSIVWTKLSSLEEAVLKIGKVLADIMDISKRGNHSLEALQTQVVTLSDTCANISKSITPYRCEGPAVIVNREGTKSTDTCSTKALHELTGNSELQLRATNNNHGVQKQSEQSRGQGAIGGGCGSGALAQPTDSESEQDRVPFNKVYSRAEQRRQREKAAEKRKTISPLQQGLSTCVSPPASQRDDLQPAAKRPATDSTRWPSYSGHYSSAGIPNANIRQVSPTSGRVRVKLTGQRDCNSLKAAEKDNSPISIFCVSNVGMDYNVGTIRKFCKDLDVRVRFCFDVTSSNSTARAFKLAVSADDSRLIEDESVWPSRIVVRSWRLNNGRPQQRVDDEDYSSSSGYTQSSVQRRLNIAKHLAADAASTNVMSSDNYNIASTTCINDRPNNSDVAVRFTDCAAEAANLLVSELRRECLSTKSVEGDGIQCAARFSTTAASSDSTAVTDSHSQDTLSLIADLTASVSSESGQHAAADMELTSS